MTTIFQDNEYYDLQIDNDRSFLASFGNYIDIYENNKLIKRILIDDIDGIKFLSLSENSIHGEFRQIDQIDNNIWITFDLNTLTLDFSCDNGRMWEDITYQDGNEIRKFLTMGLKNA
jgi:hypothetical protein